MTTNNGKLPTKMGKLLQLCHHRLREIEVDDNYIISMLHKHMPHSSSGRTYVSLGGILLATEFDIRPDLEVRSYSELTPDYDIAHKDLMRLESVDYFAVGRVQRAFTLIGKHFPRTLDIRVTNYLASPSQFKEDLKSVSVILQQNKL